MKRVIKIFCVALTIIACFIALTTVGQATAKSKQIKQLLSVPFGTIAKLTIEIVDGDKLNDKGYEGSYLFKIKTLNGVKLSKSIIVEFKDETDKFPADDFQLYKYLYG
jgi:hypothetical protein